MLQGGQQVHLQAAFNLDTFRSYSPVIGRIGEFCHADTRSLDGNRKPAKSRYARFFVLCQPLRMARALFCAGIHLTAVTMTHRRQFNDIAVQVAQLDRIGETTIAHAAEPLVGADRI